MQVYVLIIVTFPINNNKNIYIILMFKMGTKKKKKNLWLLYLDVIK